ncbi:TRNA U55 pseudouridine synthase TruB [uncultured virus]|nr:TRNA U55 pseudouridine synthase TruB [uncultured virus]
MSIVWTHKPIGWSPKDCVDEYRRSTGKTDKVAFAGRLDPMAYGLLPLVINGNRESSTILENQYKTYKFKVILGITTDTYDILGLIQDIKLNFILNKEEIQRLLHDCSQITNQEYPPYSSKTVYDEVTGKQTQLWKLANMGRLPTILPIHEVNIEYLKLLKNKVVSGEELISKVNIRINSLSKSKDMRKEAILNDWNRRFRFESNIVQLCSSKECYENELKNNRFQIITCEARVSSGTYIRGLANMMGGTCFDINRVGYGSINVDNTDKFQLRSRTMFDSKRNRKSCFATF